MIQLSFIDDRSAVGAGEQILAEASVADSKGNEGAVAEDDPTYWRKLPGWFTVIMIEIIETYEKKK